MEKPKHINPGLYAILFEQLKDIAKLFGYNLVIHGSLNRDLDLIAIPWDDNCCFTKEQLMIKEFQVYLTGIEETKPNDEVHYTILPGGRHSYTIELNRGNRHGEWVRFEDCQYYLDISVTPFIKSSLIKKLDEILNKESETEKYIKSMSDIKPEDLNKTYDI